MIFNLICTTRICRVDLLCRQSFFLYCSVEPLHTHFRGGTSRSARLGLFFPVPVIQCIFNLFSIRLLSSLSTSSAFHLYVTFIQAQVTSTQSHSFLRTSYLLVLIRWLILFISFYFHSGLVLLELSHTLPILDPRQRYLQRPFRWYLILISHLLTFFPSLRAF